MRARVPIGVLLCFIAAVAAGRPAHAQNYHVMYAEDFATCSTTPCGTSSNPWVSTNSDGTGGIQEAIDECFSTLGNQMDGCTVIMPKGYVSVTATIDVAQGQRKEGLILRGHGSGEKSTSNTVSFAGTTLVWGGSSGGTVMKIASTSWSRFEDFSIDGGGSGYGNGTAGIAIDITADNDVAPSQQNMFKNIYIRDINGSPGIGIRVAPYPLTDQTSEISFEDITISYVTTGVFQDGGQTANVHWTRVNIFGYKDYGMDFKNGVVYTDSCTFIPDPEWDPSIADVYVEPAAAWALFHNNYHETKSGVSYKFANSTSRYEASTFLNTRVLWFLAGGNIIDYQQVGPVSLIGCTFHLSDPGTKYGVVNINAPTGSGTATVSSFGNNFGWGSVNDGTKMLIQGNASLISNDNPLKADGTPIASNTAHEYFRAGLVFEHGSFNWKNTGESIKFKQELNGDLLRLMDGSNNVFSWWSNTGVLHLQKSTSALEFEGSSDDNNDTLLVAANATAPRTITLPNQSGTVLTDAEATVTFDGEWDTVAEINARLTDGKTLATLAGTEILTNKTLTSSTNAFPALGLLSFQGAGPGGGDDFFGPGGAVDINTETNVQAFVPAMTVKRLQCYTPANLTGGKSWGIYLRRGTSSPSDVLGPCTLDSTHATCTVTGTATYNGSSERLSLRVNGSSNPSGRVNCTATVGF